jgi:hypothetical protein
MRFFRQEDVTGQGKTRIFAYAAVSGKARWGESRCIARFPAKYFH